MPRPCGKVLHFLALWKHTRHTHIYTFKSAVRCALAFIINWSYIGMAASGHMSFFLCMNEIRESSLEGGGGGERSIVIIIPLYLKLGLGMLREVWAWAGGGLFRIYYYYLSSCPAPRVRRRSVYTLQRYQSPYRLVRITGILIKPVPL